jgi:hypothetical protein
MKTTEAAQLLRKAGDAIGALVAHLQSCDACTQGQPCLKATELDNAVTSAQIDADTILEHAVAYTPEAARHLAQAREHARQRRKTS